MTQTPLDGLRQRSGLAGSINLQLAATRFRCDRVAVPAESGALAGCPHSTVVRQRELVTPGALMLSNLMLTTAYRRNGYAFARALFGQGRGRRLQLRTISGWACRMRNASFVSTREAGKARNVEKSQGGSRTLIRGLDLLDAVAEGPLTLSALAEKVALTRSTAHRLATALTERRFLTYSPRLGYKLGPKLLHLGSVAQQQLDLVQVARPLLNELAASSGDTVHLAVLDEQSALYLEKIPGRRRVEISSRVGDRQPLTSTGLGKALLLGGDLQSWRAQFDAEQEKAGSRVDFDLWCERMVRYSEAGIAFDLEENEDQIRCVAAPVRDASGAVVAAISVSSAAQYMSDDRMASLSQTVGKTAADISEELGWQIRGASRSAVLNDRASLLSFVEPGPIQSPAR